MSNPPKKKPQELIFSNCRETVEEKYPDNFEEALMYMDYFEDENIVGDGFNFGNQTLCFSDVLHQPALEQIAIVLKSNPSIGTSEDEEKDNKKLARALGKRFPQLIKQTPDALAFFNPKAPVPKSNPKATSKSRTKQKKNGKAGCGCLIILIIVAAVIYSWLKK